MMCLVCAPTAYAKASARWQSVDYLLDSFVEIAMRNEYSSGQSPARKWNKPVNYFFVHRVAVQSLHEQLNIPRLPGDIT